MNDNLIALSSMAMDLKRVALGLHNKSFALASRFSEEVKKRNSEIHRDAVAPYMDTILTKVDALLSESKIDRKAEDALMYSTLIQNYVITSL